VRALSVALMAAADPSQPADPCRPVVSEVTTALTLLRGADLSKLWALGGGEVAGVMGGLEMIRAVVEAAQAAVVTEARSRGLGAEDGWGTADWAMQAAPGLSVERASELQVVAAAAADGRLGSLAALTVSAELPVGKAAQIARFHHEVRGLADAADLAAATAALVEGASGASGLTRRQLALAIRHAGQLLRPEPDLVAEEEVRRAHRGLYRSSGPLGMTTYRLVLDPEGSAILDAAIDPLARPRRDDTTREADPRTPAARRADALVAVVGRGVSSPGEAPKTVRASVVVTIPLAHLVDGLRGAGMTLGQELLSPTTVRQMACDAEVVPMVPAPEVRHLMWAGPTGWCREPSGWPRGGATEGAAIRAARCPRSGAT
jgi:hypothetical protein